jgi:hypothetical protein
MAARIVLNCSGVSMTLPRRAGRAARASGGVVMAGDSGQERGSANPDGVYVVQGVQSVLGRGGVGILTPISWFWTHAD